LPTNEKCRGKQPKYQMQLNQHGIFAIHKKKNQHGILVTLNRDCMFCNQLLICPIIFLQHDLNVYSSKFLIITTTKLPSFKKNNHKIQKGGLTQGNKTNV
jgi:hypothetical protein